MLIALSAWGRRLVYRLHVGFMILILAFLSGCSFHPDRKQVVEEGDFIEPVSSDDKQDVWKEIADLKAQVEHLR